MPLTVPARTLPVVAAYDVVVGGSGSAGLCAAIASARMGARTAIIDWMPVVGGTAASGLPLLTTNDGRGRQLTKGICEELLERLRDEAAFEGDLRTEHYFCYDVDKYRLICARMLAEAGVDIHTFTAITGVVQEEDRLTHLTIHRKEGPAALQARAVVDCTGDADIAWLAGEPMQAPELDGFPQPPTLVFFVANVDETRMPPWHEIQRLHDALRPTKQWRNPRCGAAQSPPFRYPGKPGFLGMNVTRSLDIDATKTADLVRMEIDQREQVDEYVHRFLRPCVPGFERAYLAGCGPISGIRETRRIRGPFVYASAHIHAGTEFPDAIAWSSYPIDRHNPRRGSTALNGTSLGQDVGMQDVAVAAAAAAIDPATTPSRHYYSIPFRILVPERTRNLLVAGRCMSADELAFAALRAMGTTMPMGEAAGIGAALIAQQHWTAQNVPATLVREELGRRGSLVVERADTACAR